MKEIVDKKTGEVKWKKKKKKRTETHRYGGGNLSFSRWLFDYTWSEAFKDKMKRKFFLNPSSFFFFPVLNEDASDVIWPFTVWNAFFLSKSGKKKEKKKWRESLKFFYPKKIKRPTMKVWSTLRGCCAANTFLELDYFSFYVNIFLFSLVASLDCKPT